MPFTERQQVLDNFNAIHERMQPQIEKLFDLKPKTGFEVRRTEEFRERSASAEYNPGSKDGTRPGIFYTTRWGYYHYLCDKRGISGL